MSKKIAYVWFIVLGVSILLILGGALTVDNVRYRGDKQFEVGELKNWETEYKDEPDENGIYTITYKNTIGDIAPGGDFLMFFVHHGDVYTYVDGELMYSMVMDKSDSFYNVVSGDSWNAVFLEEKYEGSEIEIVVKTEYSSYLDYVPEFYLGDRTAIVKNEFMQEAVGLILATAIFVVGLVIVVYSLIVRKTRSNPYNVLYLGVFAIMISVWFILNTPIINMVFDNGTVLKYMSYMLMGSMAVPFILFEKSIIHEKFDKVCDYLSIAVIAVQLIVVIMQIFNVMDMKDSLFMIHISMGLSVVIMVIVMILNLKLFGLKNLSHINKINILCGIMTAIGVGIDMLYYYIDSIGGRNYIFSKFAILVYTIALCYNSMRETQRLMKKGREAQKYEKLAYRDELTGVYNRTACNEYMKKLNLEDGEYTVIMFDLNNLKRCNDTHGHNMGDEYIISCADAIQEAFLMVGNCYRIGGDEFCVIGRNISEDTIENCYCMLGAKINIYNQEHPEMRMSVAHGHVKYDPEIDEDLKDTRGRADKLMYKNKVDMKSLMEKRQTL